MIVNFLSLGIFHMDTCEGTHGCKGVSLMRCNYSALLDAPCGSAVRVILKLSRTPRLLEQALLAACARVSLRSRQILLDLVVSPDYSVRTCLQLCRSHGLCYCLRKSGRNQQTLAFTGIINCLESLGERYKTDYSAYIIAILIDKYYCTFFFFGFFLFSVLFNCYDLFSCMRFH